MKFQPINKKLKNGKSITVRQCDENDAKQLLQTAKTYIFQSEYMPFENNEFNPSLEDEKKRIQTFENADNRLLLLAIHNGQVVGNIDLSGGKLKRLSHTATIGMGILKEWRNLGLGSILMESIIGWAKNHPQLEILYLHVFGGNTAAIALYKKFGFNEICRQKDFIKLGQNKYDDNLIMELKINST